MSVNMSSVFGKINSWKKTPQGQARMKEKVEEYLRGGVKKTAAGSDVIDESRIYGAAARLEQMLKDYAISRDLPASVQDHFTRTDATKPVVLPDGSIAVTVFFEDQFDGGLHRDSLMPTVYDGIDNIIVLINNGYDYHPNMAKVSGIWHGAFYTGKTQRAGTHIIQQVVDDFNGNYGSEYNVTAVAGSDFYTL